MLGVTRIEETAAQYANHNIFLFMGGFILALAIERWGLHRRLALNVIHVVGVQQRRIVLGFMAASAFLSMWISNTATTVMMLPIALAVVRALEQLEARRLAESRSAFATALMLGVAYAASIGGVVTPIGTPPNIAFAGQFSRLFPDGPEIGFGMWVLLWAPLALTFIPATWFVLVRWVCPVRNAGGGASLAVIREQRARLPRLAGAERRVLVLFILAAVLWMTRSLPLGETNYGWASLLERWLAPRDGSAPWFRATQIKDATIAIGAAIALFLLPGDRAADGTPQRLMDWPTAERLPWGILLLFGGGFAIAHAFRVSGLSEWCGDAFAGAQIGHPLGTIAATCGMLTFLTEITSNTATTQVMLPIVAEAAPGLGVNPLLLMLAATISASCAFMLPVATPPNAIVYGSGYVDMKTMVRAGLVLNVLGIVLVTALLLVWVAPLLGLNPVGLPDWAR
ncbi:MAG: SLC13/DASS family transporter [Planctomycetota bacterium]|nr:MAG: SLC13/DASS family transporter [Planctomycetota bacterium]